MALLESELRGGDVVKFMINPIYSCESKTVTNGGATTMELAAGYPMDDNVPVVQGTEGNCDGLLIQPVKIPAGESRKVAVLARGPGVINEDALPEDDHAGDSFTVATYQAAMEALLVIARDEPETQEVQTT